MLYFVVIDCSENSSQKQRFVVQNHEAVPVKLIFKLFEHSSRRESKWLPFPTAKQPQS